MGTKIHFTEKQIKHIINLYIEDGISLKNIGIEFNVSKSVIKQILTNNNIPIRSNSINYEKFNSDMWFSGDTWYYNVTCGVCGNNRVCYAKEKHYAVRGLRNKKNTMCKPCSSSGEKNGFYGKKHKKETIYKISKVRKNQPSGQHMKTKKYKKMFSKIMKERWENGVINRDNVIKKIKENHSKGKMLKGLNHSKYEEEIWEILDRFKITYDRWFQLEEKNYDIYIPKYNLLLEFNGDYFHCNPKMYEENFFNEVKKKTAKEIWELDKTKIYLANKNNYNLEIIWESDYKLDDKLINKIIKKYEKKYEYPRPED